MGAGCRCCQRASCLTYSTCPASSFSLVGSQVSEPISLRNSKQARRVPSISRWSFHPLWHRQRLQERMCFRATLHTFVLCLGTMISDAAYSQCALKQEEAKLDSQLQSLAAQPQGGRDVCSAPRMEAAGQTVAVLRRKINLYGRARASRGCRVSANAEQTAERAIGAANKLIALCAKLKAQAKPPAPRPAAVPAPVPSPAAAPKTPAAPPRPSGAQAQLAPQRERFEPDHAVSCGSDITGTKAGSSPPSATECLKGAKWTGSAPYNHSRARIAFRPYRGPPIAIGFGESLWSVPNEASPSGRRLEARPWDKTTTFAPFTGKCAVEHASARIEPFIVRMECEIQRQQKLEDEFESREDKFPYMDAEECKAPWTVSMTQGWEKHPSSYWQQHEQEPVGYCVGPMRDNRQDRRPLRQPHWYPVEECQRISDIVGKEYQVGVSRRGVRGCSFK